MPASTGYPAELLHNPGEGDENDAVVVEFRGVRVTITPRSAEMNEAKGTEPGTMLVLIDTEFERSTTISVQINDDPTWEGEIC